MMPLPPETIRLLDCYLKTERPLTNAAQVFVSLKGKARGKPMTKAGWRSLFRHHRAVTTVLKANPHRFRHTFGSDMIRAGVSLPALQRLMGHSNIETTLLYIQISPQDVYEEYARAVARQTAPARIAQP
jgi:integrase/recombinase XerD